MTNSDRAPSSSPQSINASGASSEPSLPPNKSSGDIVERLREPAAKFGFEEWDPTFDVRQDAATAIERRDRLISAHQQQIIDGSAMLAAKDAEIERLGRVCNDLSDELDLREQEGCMDDDALRQLEARALTAESSRDAAVKAAIKGEREACARIAEDQRVGSIDGTDEIYNRACDHVATAIRNASQREG